MGQRVRIKEQYGTPAFAARYLEIMASFAEPEYAAAGTFSKLIESYFGSERFKKLTPKTRQEYRLHLERMKERFGKLSPKGLSTLVLMKYHESLAATPASANNMLKAVRALMKYAITQGVVESNPVTRDIEKHSGGHIEAWTPREIEHFKCSGSVKTAFMLALYTGQRLGDVLRMRFADIKDGYIEVTQEKTGEELKVPLHPALTDYLGNIKRDTIYIVSNKYGAPYTKSGFQSNWRRANPPKPFHGLRKTFTAGLADIGATNAQIKAVTGHKTDQMVTLYSESASQKRGAGEVKKLWEG